MSASAALTCELDGRGTNRLSRMRSEGQLVLRPTHAKGFEPWAHHQAGVARVSLSAGTAGPLGGDRLHLEVVIGDGASLVLNEISATLALPGTTGDRSLMSIDVQVGEGASFIWLPEPVIAARGCDHRQEVRVRLARSARVLLREELIMGRHGERPGAIAQRVRVTRGGGVLYDQELRLGGRHIGWNTPAVAGSAKCVGSTLVVDPGSAIGAGSAALGARSEIVDDSTVIMGIAPDTVQISSVGEDNLAVGRSTVNALKSLGPPWAQS
ncbi:urease accessory protein UreD [Nocardiopsis sp. NPDC006832]|uniref:urease accessory protein UreD n=1 Tax=Nocardiopsis sp. NPDC006832 TaxID=3157188 RepID=UPI0033E79836